MTYRSLLIGVALVAIAVSASDAKTYNAVKLFQTQTNNDTNIWSYLATDGHGHNGDYSLLTNVGTYAVTKGRRQISLPDWNTSDEFNIPLFVANSKSAAVNSASFDNQEFVFPGKTMLYHPGNSNVGAVLSFLVTKSGTATITYDYTALDWTCGDTAQGIDWSVELNYGNGSLASGSLVSQEQDDIDTTGTQQLSVAVSQGDRINYIVDAVSDPPDCDSTGLVTTVSIK
jgi:hypothetical protein